MLARRFTFFQRFCRSYHSTIIPSTQFEKQQWKNGKGEALEMYRRDGQFRLSKATMNADVDFSHFPDTVRVLLPLPNSVTHSLMQNNSERDKHSKDKVQIGVKQAKK